MAPASSSQRRSHARLSPDHGLTVPSVSIAIVVVSVFVAVLVASSSGGRSRRAGGRFAPSCGNPHHKLWRSSASSPLRTVSTQLLRATQGEGLRLNRRRKLCEDCIAKLVNKPAYRHLFVTVSTEKDYTVCRQSNIVHQSVKLSSNRHQSDINLLLAHNSQLCQAQTPSR